MSDCPGKVNDVQLTIKGSKCYVVMYVDAGNRAAMYEPGLI